MTARNYRTTKGTELPLLNLRGREYLEVKYRLVWFREDHPDWSIETDLMQVTDTSAYAKATVRDEAGRVIATSHKFESIQGFPDFIEKAETGAIGRALALIGYGTQFCADELDEGARIVDAPVPINKSGKRPASAIRPPASRDGDEASQQEAQGHQVEGNDSSPIQHDQPPVEHSEISAASNESRDVNPVRSIDPGDYLISFGRKYKGKKLKDIPKSEIEGYIEWLENSAVRQGTPLSQQVQFLKNAFSRLYDAQENNASH